MIYADRAQAGQLLARRLERYRDDPDAIVLALPRGGVPVAYEVARALNLPLDVFVVRKLGFPGEEEHAMGAVASGGVRVMNPGVASMRLPRPVVEAVTLRESEEVVRRERLYRGDRPRLALDGRTAILVDDGLATGSTMHAAARAVRKLAPKRIVVAVPVAARETCATFGAVVEETVCAETPAPFASVGAWYRDFAQTSDDEVRRLLDEALRFAPARVR